MNGKSHKLIGIVTIAAVAVTVPEFIWLGHKVYPGAGLLVANASTKLADLDLEGTEYGRKVKLLSRIFTHRGMTHTLLPIALVLYSSVLTSYIPSDILASAFLSLLVGFAIGYGSHLYADSNNYKGIPLFFPVVNKKIHILAVTTTDWKDKSVINQEDIFVGIYVLLMIAHITGVLMGVTI